MFSWILNYLNLLTAFILCLSTSGLQTEKSGWNFDPNTQYHIQTDEGPERYFRFQTLNGQYRKEKRLVDGTVIGTEGWLDPLGYLRLKDYIADNNGFRILRSKMVYVGNNRPIYDAVTEVKRVPTQTGIFVKPRRPPNPFRSKTEHVVPVFDNAINSEYYASTTAKPQAKSPTFTSNDYYYNMNPTSLSSGLRDLNNYSQSQNYNILQPKMPLNQPHIQLSTIHTSSTSRNNPTEFPEFDGTYNIANGFQYYLKRQYHEEEQDSTGSNIGSFGYIDPFGIRRVIYYKTDPQSSTFYHKKNNKYVGFASTPYDLSLHNLYRRNLRSVN
ncbi:uncharacterized protein LOC122717603 isoform X1 [Apis laboriosa]|uniref:uncharacterized protein LOC122717603 isoform X1 n=1 Tax=Apis laboriosa TaxID=183418 RepID=UPI001CC342CE|nr:uncharacterized protein LOC122717603 isoform X1 [Apis laboriosa]XP_043797762.1 uncharacterized protein LOC122717603 isoform X1 [Apis laboriosa]